MRKLYISMLAALLVLSSVALANMMDWNNGMMGWPGGMMGGWFWPLSFGFGAFGIFIGIIWILAFIFWLWMFIDAITRKFNDSVEKLIWILVIVFVNIIGALIYYFVIKARDRTSAARRPVSQRPTKITR